MINHVDFSITAPTSRLIKSSSNISFRNSIVLSIYVNFRGIISDSYFPSPGIEFQRTFMEGWIKMWAGQHRYNLPTGWNEVFYNRKNQVQINDIKEVMTIQELQNKNSKKNRTILNLCNGHLEQLYGVRILPHSRISQTHI